MKKPLTVEMRRHVRADVALAVVLGHLGTDNLKRFREDERMRFVCDAPGGKVWFRIETQAEADRETEIMRHAVRNYFRDAVNRASAGYVPPPGPWIEQDIGREDHIRRTMAGFFTLRDGEGNGLATAMIPPDGQGAPIIVGPSNADPYPEHMAAIDALGEHFGIALDRARCYPYHRGAVTGLPGPDLPSVR